MEVVFLGMTSRVRDLFFNTEVNVSGNLSKILVGDKIYVAQPLTAFGSTHFGSISALARPLIRWTVNCLPKTPVLP